jgi:hypothetical protein
MLPSGDTVTQPQNPQTRLGGLVDVGDRNPSFPILEQELILKTLIRSCGLIFVHVHQTTAPVD